MKKLYFVGGTEEFFRFLRLAFPGELVRFPSVEAAAAAALREAPEALVLLPGETVPIPTVSFDGMRALAELRRRGQKLYLEEYDWGDYNSRGIFGFIADTAPRAIYDEVLNYGGKLLQLRRKRFIPGRFEESGTGTAECLATLENAIGVHKPVIPGTVSFPALVRKESFLSAAFGLSRYDRYTDLPRRSWRELYAELFAPLLGAGKDAAEKAFDAVWPPVALAGEGADCAAAAARAVEWHLNSGILPDDTGRSGAYEMLRSSDLTVRMNQRVDAMLLTAALLATAGGRFGKPELVEKGKALADYCLAEGMQFSSGPNRGAFHWFNDLGAGQCFVWSSDSGRDALAMLQLWRVTGEARYLASAEAYGDTLLRWFGGRPFLPRAWFDPFRDNVEELPADKVPHNAPSFYDAPTVLLSALWRITGKEAYREQVRRTVEAIESVDPDFEMNFSPLTYNLLYSRLLFILAAAQEIGCGDHAKRINELLEFFLDLQSPSGGIADSAVIRAAQTFTHPEFSVGMGKGYDSVVDHLYCTNNLLGALSILRRLSEPKGVRAELVTRLREGLLRFVCETQLTEPDARLYGGWMRAFDLETGEYYGINKDKDWGPYCVMGGWVMGFLPLLLLEECGAPGIYRIGGKENEERTK